MMLGACASFRETSAVGLKVQDRTHAQTKSQLWSPREYGARNGQWRILSTQSQRANVRALWAGLPAGQVGRRKAGPWLTF
jgi:hypothetical protein